MGDKFDMDQPPVIAEAWASVKDTYTLGELEGPVSVQMALRDAGKWYTTLELDDDLVSIDFFVLKPKEGAEIPGVDSYEHSGKTRYLRSGFSAIRSGEHGYLTEDEVEALRPGLRIRVVIESVEKDTKITSQIKAYKNNPSDVAALVKVISDGLDELEVPKKSYE